MKKFRKTKDKETLEDKSPNHYYVLKTKNTPLYLKVFLLVGRLSSIFETCFWFLFSFRIVLCYVETFPKPLTYSDLFIISSKFET